MGTRHRYLLPVFALVLTTGLLGCTAVPAEGSGTSPRPSDTASVIRTPAASVPTSRLALECADLLPADLVAATVATDLVATPYANPSVATPLAYAVDQLGGLSCSADNGVPTRDDGAAGDGFRSASVLVLLEAADQYTTYAETYPGVVTGADAPFGDSSRVGCSGRGSDSSCTGSIVVGETWIEIALQGVDVASTLSDADVTAHIAPLIDSIVATVANAGVPSARWVAPADTAALPDECSGYATVDEVRAALGTTADLDVRTAGGGGYSLSAGAGVHADVDRCSWSVDGADIGVALVYALPGGAWAFDASVAETTSAGLTETVAKPIVGVDRAAFGCEIMIVMCTLDTVIGGNWVQFSAGTAPDTAPQTDTATVRDRLAELATIAASRIVV